MEDAVRHTILGKIRFLVSAIPCHAMPCRAIPYHIIRYHVAILSGDQQKDRMVGDGMVGVQIE